MKPEAGVLVGQRQRQGHRHHREREPHPVARDVRLPYRVGLGREDGRHADRAGTQPSGDQLGEHDHHADRRHRPGHRRSSTQRTEDQHVQKETQKSADSQRGHERGHERPVAADVHRYGQAGNRVEEVPLSQEGVLIGAEEGDGAGREVDDAGAAVGDDQAEGQRREHRAVGQPQEQEYESLHGRSGPPQSFRNGERSIVLYAVGLPLLFRVVARYPVEQIAGAKDTCI